MEVISGSAISLTADERDLLAELVDRERTNLPIEIHHTRTGKFREMLKHRLEIVESISDRLNQT
jgi:hypothetical protein